MSDVDILQEQQQREQTSGGATEDSLSKNELKDPNSDKLKSAALGSKSGMSGAGAPAPTPNGKEGGGDKLSDKLTLSGLGVAGGGSGRKFERVQSEQTTLSLDIPTPVPGLSVTVVGGMESEKTTKGKDEVWTKYAANVSVGVKFSFFIFSLTATIDGMVEGEVKGNKEAQDVAKEAFTEFGRWKIADEFGAKKDEAMAKLTKGFTDARGSVRGAFDELRGVSDDDYANATGGSFWFSKSPREKVIKAGDNLQDSIRDAFKLLKAEPDGDEFEAYFNTGKIASFMEQLGVYNSASEAGSAIDAAYGEFNKHLTEGEGKTLKGLGALTGKNNPDVSFKARATISVGFSAKANKAEFGLKVSGGVEISDGDGEDFDQEVKPVILGSVSASIGDFSGELSGAYSPRDSTFELGLDLKTPKITIPFDDEALGDLAESVEEIMGGDEAKEGADTKKPTDNPEDSLKARLKAKLAKAQKIKDSFDKVKKAYESAKKAFKPSKRNVLLGGKIEWESGKRSGGEVYAGLGDGDETDLGPISKESMKANKLVMKF